MAELITDREGIATFPFGVERHVSVLRQRILHSLRAKSSESIREAQVDVVLKPGLVRAVVLARIERLHDVFLASVPVFGCGGQVLQVDQEVLCPVLQVFARCGAASMPADPVADVLREARGIRRSSLARRNHRARRIGHL